MGKPQGAFIRLRRRQGDDLYRLRKAKDVSRATLAEAAGVTVGAVQQWENGRTTPRPASQIAITRVLGSNPFAIDGEAAA